MNKTNIPTLKSVEEIESFLGKKINGVYNFKEGQEKIFHIAPGDVIYSRNYPCFMFRPFSKVNKDYKFNHNTGVMEIRGRDLWKRKFETKKFQLEKIGYKLPTTHLPEGYIWGNPVEINTK
jgi:hypothetical protein